MPIAPALISIIIPTKNRCDLLRETLASVQAQSYPQWEAVVVDDGSTDDTAEWLATLTAAEPRIRFLRRHGTASGACVCRNQGVTAAQGAYIIFLDSDDLLAAGCLADRLAFMEEHVETDFAVFACEVFREHPGDMGLLQNVATEEADLDRFLKLDNPWQIHQPIWRRTALQRLGPWEETLPSFQDWEFHLRALLAKFRYRLVPFRDCYLRIAHEQRESVGARQYAPEHLAAHSRLLDQTAIRLSEQKLLSPDRRRNLVGLYLHLAGRSERRGHPAAARCLWRACRDHRLASRTEYSAGWLWLHAARCRGGWRVRDWLRIKLAARYPVLQGSRTMWQVPVATLSGGVNDRTVSQPVGTADQP